MEPSTLWLVLSLYLASVVVSSTVPAPLSSCKAENRVLVETRNITAGGYEFQVSTKACSPDVGTPRTLEKRETLNACIAENLSFNCVTGGAARGPLGADCGHLELAVVAAFQKPGASDPPGFTVDPQFAAEFALGTCLWAWINENPVGGPTLEFCYSELSTTLGPTLDFDCVINAGLNGYTGGFVVPSSATADPRALDWVFE
ncbi:hypothetical protein DFH06DRAFT_1467189 [Mycena polygramma]|nr:hypothetical protein DFH06DRAFT_1467189 [Mycena polygramma]